MAPERYRLYARSPGAPTCVLDHPVHGRGTWHLSVCKPARRERRCAACGCRLVVGWNVWRRVPPPNNHSRADRICCPCVDWMARSGQ